MRTYKLTIAYDGTNYQGWQRQSDTDRTIQGILEETLENCIGYQVQIDGSGIFVSYGENIDRNFT